MKTSSLLLLTLITCPSSQNKKSFSWFIFVGISLIFTFVNYQNYSAKVDENEKQYHDLKSEYEDVMKKQKPVSEDDVKNGLNSAK